MNLEDPVSVTKIKRNLFKIPMDKLGEINDFIEFILKKSESGSSKRVEKLEGIWEGIGFERIVDLDESIRELRGESEKSLVDRIEKCNT